MEVPPPLAKAVGLGRHGGDRGANQHARWGEEKYQVGNAKLAPSPSSGGMCATYTLARLRRDRPDLAAQVEAGELSAHAAAIEAGFRRKPTPPDELRRAWAKASP
jgi:hypothetical protein